MYFPPANLTIWLRCSSFYGVQASTRTVEKRNTNLLRRSSRHWRGSSCVAGFGRWPQIADTRRPVDFPRFQRHAIRRCHTVRSLWILYR